MGVSYHVSLQKSALKAYLSVESAAFRVSMGVSRHATSQKISFRYTSAQGSKCIKFLKINMLFGCLCVWAATRVRRKCPEGIPEYGQQQICVYIYIYMCIERERCPCENSVVHLSVRVSHHVSSQKSSLKVYLSVGSNIYRYP